ncbi:hypothetical protein BC831DRAFT_452184 [Entophlyctis helioformis]|nr:hypothetical protein BC831DRAFT_452184 [Entophlyctis helioformis]
MPLLQIKWGKWAAGRADKVMQERVCRHSLAQLGTAWHRGDSTACYCWREQCEPVPCLQREMALVPFSRQLGRSRRQATCAHGQRALVCLVLGQSGQPSPVSPV